MIPRMLFVKKGELVDHRGGNNVPIQHVARVEEKTPKLVYSWV